MKKLERFVFALSMKDRVEFYINENELMNKNLPQHVFILPTQLLWRLIMYNCNPVHSSFFHNSRLIRRI